MKNIINEELGFMKYLLGYKRGVVVSEQAKPIIKKEKNVQAAYQLIIDEATETVLPKSENKDGWIELYKYYKSDKDPNWKFNKFGDKDGKSVTYEVILVYSKDTNDSDSWMLIYDDGTVFTHNRGRGTGRAYGYWEWDETKPKIYFKDKTRKAIGYVQQTDTDWSAVTDNNKVIGLNAKSPLVKEIQKKLIEIGYSGTTGNPITTDVAGCKDKVEKCDGIYGKSTKEMVVQYQKDNGLDVDGVVGKQTYDALF